MRFHAQRVLSKWAAREGVTHGVDRYGNLGGNKCRRDEVMIGGGNGCGRGDRGAQADAV